MGKKAFPLLLLFLLSLLPAQSQNNRHTDSLVGLLQTTHTDTVRAKLLNELVWELIYTNPAQAENYAKEERELCEKAGFKRGLFDSYTALGSVRYVQSDLAAALEYHKQALACSRQNNYLKGLMIANSNIGVVYKDLGNHLLETHYCLAAMKTAETLGDSMRMSAIYSNLGLAYQGQKSYEQALAFNEKALAIREKRHDQRGIAACYINIASILTDQNKLSEAVDYQLKALTLATPLQDNYLLAKCYSNLGLSYKKLNQNELALQNLEKDLQSIHNSAAKPAWLRWRSTSGRYTIRCRRAPKRYCISKKPCKCPRKSVTRNGRWNRMPACPMHMNT